VCECVCVCVCVTRMVGLYVRVCGFEIKMTHLEDFMLLFSEKSIKLNVHFISEIHMRCPAFSLVVMSLTQKSNRAECN